MAFVTMVPNLPLQKRKLRLRFCSLALFAPSSEKAIFAFDRSYVTSAVRKSMLDILVPGNFGKIGHEISDQEGSGYVKPCGSN